MTPMQTAGLLSRFVVVAALVLGAAAAAGAQTPAIYGLSPTRGGTPGGTTVEVVGNGWFIDGVTTVAMTGSGGPPSNVTVHDSHRLTFETPARTAAAGPNGTPYTVTVTTSSISRTATFTYVRRVRNAVAGARKPVFSHDGRYMAFESRYPLVAADTNGLVDIYVRTKSTGAVRRISVASSGAQALGGESTSPSISATGRFIAFQSRATNLVGGDTNGHMDIFVHDRDADGNGVFDEAGRVTTERVNLGLLNIGATSVPVQALGGDSADPVISGSGRYVAYHSAASNLLGATPDANQRTDVFVFDRQRRVTRLVSRNGNSMPADHHSRNPGMSLSGRFIVFESLANDIAGGATTPQGAPLSDIFLHDRDTDEDGIFDEVGAFDTQLVSSNRCEANLTNHSIEPSITYDGRFVVFATVAGNANPDGNCQNVDTNQARDIFIWDRELGTITRRLSEGQGGQLPGASGAPVLSGNGNLLLFRTQAVNAGAPSTPGRVIAAVNEDGKSTTGQVPSPTTPAPPPADVPPPPPSGSTEDPSTSGDGNTTGQTTEPDPGTGGGEPMVEVDEAPEDADGTPSIGGLSPSAGPTTGGNTVEIHGANFAAAHTVYWNGNQLGATTFVNSSLLRVVAPASAAGPVDVRVVVTGELSNAAQYTYAAGLTAPSITSFATNPVSNPVSGPVTGGTVVVITGNGFSTPTVRFGPTAGTINSASANSITVTTPPSAAAGPVPIVVQNSNGTTAVSDGPFTYTFAPVVQAPSTQALTPDRGPVTGGTAITISGQHFTPASTVTIGGVPATSVQVLSNTQIVAVTPAGAEGEQAVVVTTAQGASPPQPFIYEPLAAPILTCTGTDSDLDGTPDAWELQYGFNPADATDGALDFDADGLTNAQECTALTHPRGLYTRYLAEGATGAFFDTRVVLANPGPTPSRALFRFQTETGAVVRHFLVVPGTSRRTVDLRLLAGLESANVSTTIETDVQLVVDRTMRWDRASRFGAHAETSSPAPSLLWYFAEGATHGSFDLFYLLQNPSQTQAAQVQIRYLLPSGSPIVRDITIDPNTRETIYVDQQPGLSATDVSAVIATLNGVPIIAERAMYSSAAGVFAAGHESAGVTSTSLNWFFAEGATGSFFDTFLLFANPNASPANIQATYLLPSGQTVVKAYTVQPNSRQTVNVQFEDPQLAATAVSVRLVSTNAVPFLAERSMWWPHGQAWTEAHNAAGATTTGTKWAVGDGEVGTAPDDPATFLLVANTSAAAGTVRVTLLFETGAAITKDFQVPGNSRFNVAILTTEAADGPSVMRVPRGTRFSAVVESLGGAPAQIVVERAMYWNANGQLWAAGSDLLATKLQ